jgi:hypothetical protein
VVRQGRALKATHVQGTLQVGGHSTTVASVTIEQLTDEFLQQKLLVLLQDVLK